jgi:hypothetical protein
LSLFVLEAGLTLIAAVVALCWPKTCSRWFAAVEEFFLRLARRRAHAVLAVGASAILIRLAILPAMPIPEPFIHDEFSFLLAADTFAAGRLTNPTHPLWEHFESFHITQQPTYMSMYFPAQGLVMAAGQVLFGHPWYGIVLSCGLMCAALCWMLQGWLPPGWAFFGGMLAVLRLALFSNWVNGYYGGAVAATGGALVLGALPRMKHGANVRDGFVLALGAIVLANSRPYEGVLLCGPAAIYVLKERLWRRLAAPAVLVLVAAGLMAYYNHRVFGKALTLPYQINRATYASAPVFLWQSPRPSPEYRHEVMRDFYQTWEMGDFRFARTARGYRAITVQKMATGLFFFLGFALIPALVMLWRVLKDRRVRFVVVAAVVFAAGLAMNAWFFPHYAAPLTGAIYVVLLQCMRHLRQWRPGGTPVGLGLVRFAPLVCLLLAGVRIYAEPLGVDIQRWPTMWYGTEPLGLQRAHVAAELATMPGRQLAIVRYSRVHLPFDDWVYNAADIDTSKVVWAREMDVESNRELLQYFHDRKVWLVEPDFDPPKVLPYRARTKITDVESEYSSRQPGR